MNAKSSKQFSNTTSSSSRRSRKHICGAFWARLGGIALRALRTGAIRLNSFHAIRLGHFLGTMAYLLTSQRRETARSDIALTFPEKSSHEVDLILRGCYENIGQNLVEFMQLPKLCSSGEIREKVTLEGEEFLKAALAKKRGIVLLTAHYGNWELVGARLAAAGYPLNVVARHQRDRATTAWVIKTREQAGMHVLMARKGDVLSILRCLRNNEIVGFLSDQNAGRKGILIDFLGRHASTHTGPALIAMRSRAPVIPVFGLRQSNGQHIARFLPEIQLHRSGNLQDDLRKNTILLTRVVEEQIRLCPELWLWLHDRWRAKRKAKKLKD